MDDEGFVEVKRKHNKSAEVRQGERGSAAEQQGRNGSRANAGRTGNRRRSARPPEQSGPTKNSPQRQHTAMSRLQRSGRSTPTADSSPASQRPANPRGAPPSSARGHTAKHSVEQRSSPHAQSDRSVPAAPRKPAWQRPNRGQPGTPAITQRVSEAQPRHDSQTIHPAECSKGTVAAVQSVPEAVGTPIQARGNAGAARPADDPSTAHGATNGFQAPPKPVSWAAAARTAAVGSSPDVPTDDATHTTNEELRIPGREKLQIRIDKSNLSSNKRSPSCSRSQAEDQHPAHQSGGSGHSSGIGTEPQSHATGVQSIAAVHVASSSASSRDAPVERSELGSAATQAASSTLEPMAQSVPQITAGEPHVRPTAVEEKVPAAGHRGTSPVTHAPVQQHSAWKSQPPAASSSPGEFGDELAVLAHSLTDDNTPVGREHACGISNPHSLCFMIAPLQAMLATRPFQALMSRLPDIKASLVVAKELPVLAGLAELADFIRSPTAAAFDPAPLSRIVEDHNEREGIRGDDSPFSVAKRQEQLDAALLYLHVVDEIHDEVNATLKRLGFREQVPQATEDDDCGWNLVGPKKQIREVRETKVAIEGRNTPFGMAFRGVLAHHNRNPGKQESINLEPFTLLNLRPEISPNGGDSVEAGLLRLCSRYRNPETGQEHRSLIAELPPVLVLQIGRFQYDRNSMQKICAPVEHPMRLQLKRDMLTQDARRQGGVYNLAAKVVHHGQTMNCGHYTTIALEGPGNWMKYDDGSVTQVSPAEAQKPDGYLLFYTIAE